MTVGVRAKLRHLGKGQTGPVADPHGTVFKAVHGVHRGHRLRLDTTVEWDRRVLASDRRALHVGHIAAHVVSRQRGNALQTCDHALRRGGD